MTVVDFAALMAMLVWPEVGRSYLLTAHPPAHVEPYDDSRPLAEGCRRLIYQSSTLKDSEVVPDSATLYSHFDAERLIYTEVSISVRLVSRVRYAVFYRDRFTYDSLGDFIEEGQAINAHRSVRFDTMRHDRLNMTFDELFDWCAGMDDYERIDAGLHSFNCHSSQSRPSDFENEVNRVDEWGRMTFRVRENAHLTREFDTRVPRLIYREFYEEYYPERSPFRSSQQRINEGAITSVDYDSNFLAEESFTTAPNGVQTRYRRIVHATYDVCLP